MDTLSSKERSARMALIRSVNSKLELKIRREIHRRGYRFRLHRRDLPGIPDVVFPSRNKILLLHGCFWHGHNCKLARLPKSKREYWIPKILANRKRDGLVRRRLRALGWDVMTVWECQARDLPHTIDRIEKFLRFDREPR